MLVTFLPSSNGFGHVNRCILLASLFKDKGWECNIWCLKKIFNRIIKTMPNIKEINCFDLSMPSIDDFITKSPLAKAFIIEASEKLSKSDLIISDNHLESLLISKNVILSANFFWHQNFLPNKQNESYSNYCSELIKKFKPSVISSKIFQDRISNSNLNNLMIGLIVNKNSLIFKNKNKINKDSILVSAGLTENATNEAIMIIQKLVENKIHLKRRIYIEPRLMNYKSWPKEIEKANYSEEMYRSLIYAFIRPGLGTLLNCLANYVCPICFTEKNNLEMINNKNVIKDNKLGFDYYDYEKSFYEPTIFENKIKYILLNIEKLDFNGANQFYDAILKI